MISSFWILYWFLLTLGVVRQFFEALGLLPYSFRYEFIVILYSMTLFGIFVYTKSLTLKPQRRNFVSLMILATYPVVSIFNGLVFGYELNYSNKYRLSDTLPVMLFFLPMIFMRIRSVTFDELSSKMFVLFGITCTIIPLTSIVLEFRYQSLMFLQYGLFFLYLSFRRPFFTLLTLSPAVILSGKRTMMGLFLVFRGGRISYIVVGILLVCILYYLSLVPSKLTNSVTYLADHYKDLTKLISYFPRVREVNAVISDLNSYGLFAWLFGFGSGYYYEIVDSTGLLISAHNAHFSPFGLISTYGLIYTALFYIFILKTIFKYPNFHLLDKVWRAYVVFALIHSFFAYSLFIDFLLFFAIWRRVRA